MTTNRPRALVWPWLRLNIIHVQKNDQIFCYLIYFFFHWKTKWTYSIKLYQIARTHTYRNKYFFITNWYKQINFSNYQYYTVLNTHIYNRGRNTKRTTAAKLSQYLVNSEVVRTSLGRVYRSGYSPLNFSIRSFVAW